MANEISRICALLDQEKKAIERFDLPRLERLANRKAQMLERVGPRGNKAELSRMKARAERNLRLLEAMKQGISDAQALLARKRGPDTYARDGNLSSFSCPEPNFHRKA